MKMDEERFEVFYKMINMGKMFESRGDELFRDEYYDDAEKCYMKAGYEYKKACLYAEDCDDRDEMEKTYAMKNNINKKIRNVRNIVNNIQ